MIKITGKIQAEKTVVWSALTKVEQLREWYFNIAEIKLEEGFQFSFYESATSKHFLHVCEVREVVVEEKFAHTWTYPEKTKGTSLVTWTLVEDGIYTNVTIEHEGIESFEDGGTDFLPANFEMGWRGFMAILKNYVNGLKKLKFEIQIDAEAEQIWEKLWNVETYKEWTAPFCQGSYYAGDLKQGGRIHFLSPDFGGMYSDVVFYVPNKMVLFQHIGEVKDGKELPLDDTTEKWTGCFEKYELITNEFGALLKVEVDVTEGHANYLGAAFPNGLNRLKELSENK
ncbi:MAG: SRPBCC family protein [Bacteroidota bacterium]